LQPDNGKTLDGDWELHADGVDGFARSGRQR
jgi:hypothetical protein